LDPSCVDKILDPVYKVGVEPERNGETVLSQYAIPGYVSSSIMDNFHYYNNIHAENQNLENHEVRFQNNHAAHTDSGLMTVVVCTDVPGLEVFDQKLNKWISLENQLHKWVKETQDVKKNPLAHRYFATVFWGDSVCYLNDKSANLNSTIHRVSSAPIERFSVVFKQRTTPTFTAPRYQEDYELAETQLAALDDLKKQNMIQWSTIFFPATILLTLYIGKKLLKL